MITKTELTARWNIDFKSLKLPIGPAQIDWAFARIGEEVAKALAAQVPPPPTPGGVTDEDKEYIKEFLEDLLKDLPPVKVLKDETAIISSLPTAVEPNLPLDTFMTKAFIEIKKYGYNECHTDVVNVLLEAIEDLEYDE